MSVYVLMESKVKDRAKFKAFIGALSDVIAEHGGRFLVRGGRIKPLLMGTELDRRQPERILIIEFPSEAHQRRCFMSPEYKAILPLAQAGAYTWAALLEDYIHEKK
jgi:uncharacterized protein (DUF1330 family)